MSRTKALGHFVSRVTTESTGGNCIVDFVELHDGRVLGINEECVVVYPCRAAFDLDCLESHELRQLDIATDCPEAITAHLWLERRKYRSLSEFTSYPTLQRAVKRHYGDGHYRTLHDAEAYYSALVDALVMGTNKKQRNA